MRKSARETAKYRTMPPALVGGLCVVVRYGLCRTIRLIWPHVPTITKFGKNLSTFLSTFQCSLDGGLLLFPKATGHDRRCRGGYSIGYSYGNSELWTSVINVALVRLHRRALHNSVQGSRAYCAPLPCIQCSTPVHTVHHSPCITCGGGGGDCIIKAPVAGTTDAKLNFMQDGAIISCSERSKAQNTVNSQLRTKLPYHRTLGEYGPRSVCSATGNALSAACLSNPRRGHVTPAMPSLQRERTCRHAL